MSSTHDSHSSVESHRGSWVEKVTIDRAHGFELATTGSLTFWITMGLLGAWRG